MKVRYRQRALSDLQVIGEYIQKRNPRAATEVVARIRIAAERLGSWPHIGHSGRVTDTHEWSVVGLPYVIVYEIDEQADEIAVIAVFHGAQNRDTE